MADIKVLGTICYWASSYEAPMFFAVYCGAAKKTQPQWYVVRTRFFYLFWSTQHSHVQYVRQDCTKHGTIIFFPTYSTYGGTIKHTSTIIFMVMSRPNNEPAVPTASNNTQRNATQQCNATMQCNATQHNTKADHCQVHTPHTIAGTKEEPLSSRWNLLVVVPDTVTPTPTLSPLMWSLSAFFVVAGLRFVFDENTRPQGRVSRLATALHSRRCTECAVATCRKRKN